MRKSSVLAGVGVVSLALLGTPLIASASASNSDTAEITGARTVIGIWGHGMSVYDTACDDDSVYGNWKTYSGKTQKVTNTNGCGTKDFGDIPMGSGTQIYFRVCVDKSWPTSDKCSGWEDVELV
jgi:hypothetical protein